MIYAQTANNDAGIPPSDEEVHAVQCLISAAVLEAPGRSFLARVIGRTYGDVEAARKVARCGPPPPKGAA